jgi:hypothetical protein
MMLGFAGLGFAAYRTRFAPARNGALLCEAAKSKPNRPNKRLE